MYEDIIELKKLNKRYTLKDKEIPALHDVSAKIQQGSIVGIIGRSGAGKSTLLRCVNALEKPDSGEVLYKELELTGAPLNTLRKIRHEMGMIFQHFNLLSRRTVFQNVALPLEILGRPKSEIIKKVSEYLKIVGLENRREAYPSELSGGQKQRVAVARALAGEAKVLLCDEATSALDPETTKDILHLLQDLNKRLGLTIILITHEIAVIRDICDTVYVMHNGRIVEGGKVESIFTNPRHDVTRSFIRSFVSSKIPEVIAEQLSEEPGEAPTDIVLRLFFSGNVSRKPVIAEYIRQTQENLNLLGGYLDHIGESTFGTLIVSLPNNPKLIEKASEFFMTHGIKLETLGFIPTYPN